MRSISDYPRSAIRHPLLATAYSLQPTA